MSRTINALETAFANVVLDLSLREVARAAADSFDNGFVTYENRTLRLRLLSDRGQPAIAVGSVVDPRTWYDLDLIANHLRNQDVLTTHSPSELASFLLRESVLLQEMFTGGYAETVRLMHSLYDQRARRMFPAGSLD